MDFGLTSDFDTFYSERVNALLSDLKNNNEFYHGLRKDVIDIREKIKNEVDNATWLKIKDLVRIHMIKAYVEGKYVYGQGMKDVITLSYHLDGEIINKEFIDSAVDDDF